MNQHVTIRFECLPLRSVSRFDVPLDASPEHQALVQRIQKATQKHGLHNSYYLYNASYILHLTNQAELGMLEFQFEGTVLTDPDDRHTLGCDLQVELLRDTCDWITEPIVHWFAETVQRAVQSEFDRYIEAGDLTKTIQRAEKLQVQSEAQGGFLGMGL